MSLSMQVKVFLLFSVFIILSLEGVYAQDVNVPFVPGVQTEDDLNLLIPITVKYDSIQNVIYGLGKQETNEIDSIKPYIQREFEGRTIMYLSRSAVEIIADRKIKMFDVEILIEEIKRLGIVKVFFVAESEYYSRIPSIWSVGFFYKLPTRDERTINDYYSSRDITFRPAESLVMQEFKRRREVSNSQSGVSESSREPAPPPPPPPPPELPRKYDDSVMKYYPNSETVIVKIDSSDQFVLNEKPITDFAQVDSVIVASLMKSQCLFVIRKDRNSSYGQYLLVIGTIRNRIFEFRDELAMERYGMKYDRLKTIQRREVTSNYPFTMIDEEIEIN